MWSGLSLAFGRALQKYSHLACFYAVLLAAQANMHIAKAQRTGQIFVFIEGVVFEQRKEFLLLYGVQICYDIKLLSTYALSFALFLSIPSQLRSF